MQAVATGSDEVVRSASSEETDSHQAIPSKQDQSPFGGNTPGSAQDGLEVYRGCCAEKERCCGGSP